MRIGNDDVDGADRKAVEEAIMRLRLRLRLSGDLDEYQASIGPSEPANPIYHYTAAAGLHGIVNDCAIFLTDPSYLSDKTELRYGRELVSEILAERKARASGALAAFYGDKMATFDPFAGHVRATFYVGSFCERSDLLSQWRTYGAGTAGFALGFPPETFTPGGSIMASAPEGAALHRIEYARDMQKQIVKYVFERCENSFATDLASVSNERDLRVLNAGYFGLFMLQLVALLPQFKHPMFHEEREWRLTLSRMREGDDE